MATARALPVNEEHQPQAPTACASCLPARRYLRGLAASTDLWQQQYVAIFGEQAPQRFDAATVRRMCRRSELRAARWLQAQVTQVALGFASTACLQVGCAHRL